MHKILVVATSRKTRGGITSVVKAHEQGRQWRKFHCRWIETHRDGNALCKLWYLIAGLLEYMCLLPFCDIVHIHLSEPSSAMRKCLFMTWAKVWRKKIIMHFHSFSSDTTIRSKWQKVYRYLFNKADSVLVLSEYWKKEVNAVFALGDKVRVLYNPCTEVLDMAIYDRTKMILFAGAINARKGYADLIRAFSKIYPDHKDWKLVFAGDGEIEQGRKLAKELGVERQTVFLGWVNGADKDKAFKEASIFCLPSYAEGFPMAVLDAWAYGLPVVATPIGGLPDIGRDNENVLFFKPGDIDRLADVLNRLMEDEGLKERISSASLDLAERAFKTDVINEQLEKLYLDLLK